MSNKITTCIWLSSDEGKLAPVVEYYKAVFGEACVPGTISSLGQTPSGYAEMCQLSIYGQPFSLMNTAQPHAPLNDAMALMISCDDQDEIDHFWNYFTKEGAESQCGWCVDRYGLRWQIIPANLGELLARPGAWDVMMNQKKIIIDQY